MARDMVLNEKEVGPFTSTISLEAKTPEAKEFETVFGTSQINIDEIVRYRDVKEYINNNKINVLNKKDFKWLK